MRGDYRPGDRDRAVRRILQWTGAGVAGTAGLAGVISAASAAGFAAANPKPTPAPVPVIPIETAPAQLVRPTPAVIVQIVHVPGGTVSAARGASISAPRQGPSAPAPSQGGSSASAPPPPPPPPACTSTPSHPC